MHKASRSEKIQSFHVMRLLARAHELQAQGRDIVHMEVGEPDFPTPQPILEAARAFMQDGDIRYTAATGIPGLKQAIADHYQREFAVSVDPRRVIISPGASGALLLALGVTLDPGQALMMTDPGYPCNRNFSYLYNAEAQTIAVDAATQYQLNAQLVATQWQPDTMGVLLASPANPTGTTVSGEALQGIHEVVQCHEATLFVDEIYQGLYYDEKPVTALAYGDDIFVINSFSKYFSMTGWRIGWLVVPPMFIDVVDKLAQNIFLAPPSIAQYAALAAFKAETIAIAEQYHDAYRQRRDYLYQALVEIGFAIPVKPSGAFYLYADCSKFTDNSYQFAEDLLEQIGVAITPGKDFGSHKAAQHVRFAYTTSMAQLEKGVARLAEYLQK